MFSAVNPLSGLAALLSVKYLLLFLVFGIALCKEIVGKNLPRMSKQEAGGITFFGHDDPLNEWNSMNENGVDSNPHIPILHPVPKCRVNRDFPIVDGFQQFAGSTGIVRRHSSRR